MVHVFAKMFYTEESLKGVMPAIKELIEETRKEDGCIKYEFCKVQGKTEEYAMVEVWRDKEVLDRHMKTAHFLEAIPQLIAFSYEKLEVTILDTLI